MDGETTDMDAEVDSQWQYEHNAENEMSPPVKSPTARKQVRLANKENGKHISF